MKIYKIWQTVNNNYDTYDSAIVVADNEEEARKISPSGRANIEFALPDGSIFYNFKPNNCNCFFMEWVEKEEDVNVEYIGKAKNGMKKGVVVASFNAG